MNTLKLGSSDPDVMYLQRYLGLEPDGQFGPKTLEALKSWQTSKGLMPDGIAGPKTWEIVMTETRRHITADSWTTLASAIGCEAAVLEAIKEVETGSTGPFDASGRPTILFEAHLFWKNLKAVGIDPARQKASHPGILSPVWNRKLYKGGSAEWTRLREAWGISPIAALRSASYGFPQILGQNFKDTRGFVADCYMSEVKQLEYFGKFLVSGGFGPSLRSRDWSAIARRYNGPQ